jgi:hypothetical protein
MPLILEPESTFEYVLDYDKAKPKDKQPTFIFKFLSSRKWKEIAGLSDIFDKGESGEAAVDVVFKAIRGSLTGWRNMKNPDGSEITFDADLLDDIVTPAEAVELMQAAVSQMPTAEDKKNPSRNQPPVRPGLQKLQRDSELP